MVSRWERTDSPQQFGKEKRKMFPRFLSSKMIQSWLPDDSRPSDTFVRLRSPCKDKARSGRRKKSLFLCLVT